MQLEDIVLIATLFAIGIFTVLFGLFA